MITAAEVSAVASETIARPTGLLNNTPSVTVNFLAEGNTPTPDNPYVFPDDGYVVIFCGDENHIGRLDIRGANGSVYIQIGNNVGRFSLFVRKGMKCSSVGGTPSTARFVQLT